MSSLGTGLKGVVLDETRISLIDGDAGKLVYRGYNIHDLAQHATTSRRSLTCSCTAPCRRATSWRASTVN